MLSEREKRRRLARELAKLNPAALNPLVDASTQACGRFWC
jgi:hypothetical protein